MFKVNLPFQKIPQASKTTGLSQYFLRNGCKDGTIPHIRSGAVYLINVPALLKKLGQINERRDEKSRPTGGTAGRDGLEIMG